ncbi:hypothetical protein Glove_187g25 [Diversispora epigaea]|uniref:BTB domain-containing protein n=1 Tax=Diversispora epigaea TaxID=1348612 RepID=A0A397IQA7_9GLOM|nr:hypothetical protein Glove_187g25 [Diversispora epigaea]
MSTNFYDRLSADFSGILESGIDYNVIIEVGEAPSNQRFKTHSLILQSRSSYFEIKLNETMLNDDNIKIIYLPEISVENFEIIIKYIYSGNISIEKTDTSSIFDILLASNKFGLDELIKYFQSYLIENNASWLRLNFSKIHQISTQENNFKLLREFCNYIIPKSPNTLFESRDFTTLSEKVLISILERDDLQMDESEIWDHIIRWGKGQHPNFPTNLNDWSDDDFLILKNTLHQCIPLIRYFSISGEDIFKKLLPYQQLFERQLWADILSKNLTSVSFKLLPPRKYKTTKFSPRNKISIDSVIITEEHALEIGSWIDKKDSPYINENPYDFQLIFRGSTDGFECINFYDNCDGISQTILVLKVKNTGEILGGYNSLVWDKYAEPYFKNDDAFIFSLKTEKQHESILSRAISGLYTIYNYNDRVGFCEDLCLHNNFNTGNSCCCSKSGYEKCIRNSTEYFSVEECEVFKVIKKKSVGQN